MKKIFAIVLFSSCLNLDPASFHHDSGAGGGFFSFGGGSGNRGGGTGGFGGGFALLDAGTGGGTAESGGGTATTGGGTATTGGGTATTGGGTATTGGGTATTGGGTATTGGGTATTGGGTATTGGGTATTGGGTATTGGGTATTGGGTATSGGGTATSGGGTATSGGGTATSGGGSATGGGSACSPVDCGKSACASNAACLNLQDGAACTLDSQCLGQSCFSESQFGLPGGFCRNATSCTVSGNIGCHGGTCVATSLLPNYCEVPCNGTGLVGASGGCRAGYICVDPDTSTTNNNNYCRPLCSNDSDCSGSGVGYGCNTWTKRCGLKNQGKAGYGSACTADSQCESDYCRKDAYAPGGYCIGLCRGDTRNCAIGGSCVYDSSTGDNRGYCYKLCTSSSSCRTAENYACWQNETFPAEGICQCLGVGVSCSSGSQCCSGSCTGFLSKTCD